MYKGKSKRNMTEKKREQISIDDVTVQNGFWLYYDDIMRSFFWLSLQTHKTQSTSASDIVYI